MEAAIGVGQKAGGEGTGRKVLGLVHINVIIILILIVINIIIIINIELCHLLKKLIYITKIAIFLYQ